MSHLLKWGGVSRGRYIAIAMIPCVIVGGIFAWKNAPIDEATRATVGEAVERFRDRANAAGEGPAGAQPGVYSYETRGSETADTSLLSATHEYDGISTVIVDRGPCGVMERWQVLTGRWTEAEFCVPPDGSGLRAITEFHEFFGRARDDTYRCRGRAPSRRLLRRVGTSWSTTCESGSSRAQSRSMVVGVEKTPVGEAKFDAVHTKTKVVLSGDVTGGTTREDWRRRSDGLLLRRTVETEAEMTGRLGGDYDESYEIEIESVEPDH